MISRALNALGFGRKPVEPKPVFADPDGLKVSPRAEQPKPVEPKPDERTLGHALADAITRPRTDPDTDWEAKFKLAATDLAKQAEDLRAFEKAVGFSFDGECPICGGIEGCSHSRGARLEAAIDILTEGLRHDANMWRNSLKRSRDRKKGVGRG